jgi:hypothetical protein
VDINQQPELEWDKNSSGFLWISSDKRWRISKQSGADYSLSQDNTRVVAYRSTDEQCKALAQRLQNAYDDVPDFDRAMLEGVSEAQPSRSVDTPVLTFEFFQSLITPATFTAATARWREDGFEPAKYLMFLSEVIVERHHELLAIKPRDVVREILQELRDDRDARTPADASDWAEFRQLESVIALIEGRRSKTGMRRR